MATCGEVLVKILENYGVDTVFGIPGVHTVELYRGMESTSIRHITPRHEQGAGFMADGYARASGKIPACFIITGPGMTNIATAMGQAMADSIPMLVISSVNRTWEIGMGEGRLHEMRNQSNMIGGVAKFSHTLMRPDELPKVLARAFSLFNCTRPGPVHIEIPIDVITAGADHIDSIAYSIAKASGANPAAIIQSAELLNGAQRPLIVVGGGAIRAAEGITELAERLDAPVMNTVNGKGIIPHTHPLSLGGSGSAGPIRDELCQSDVVLAIGTEFGETDYDYFFKGSLELKGKLIRIDIDAEQLTRNVRSDIAICSDAGNAVNAILGAVPKSAGRVRDGTERAKIVRSQMRRLRDPDYAAFFRTIRTALPGVVIAGDSTQPTYYAWLQYETDAPRKYFHSASGFGTLGYAIPAAIGAKLAVPDLPVIGLIGDGASQFSIGELASAVEAGLPVIFLIWNNTGYGEIKKFMLESGIPPIGVDIHTPDFQGIATAFGCHTANPRTLEQLGIELIKASNQQLPTVIEVQQSDFANGGPDLQPSGI